MANSIIHPSLLISASAHRSGSTWVQRILHAATDIFVWGESFPLVELLSYIYSDFKFHDSVRASETSQFLGRSQNSSLWVANINPPLTSLKRALSALFSEYYSGFGRNKYGWKEVRYDENELNFLWELFPKLRVVLLVRNPKDVIRSLKNLHWIGRFKETQSVEIVCKNWSRRTRDYLSLAKHANTFFVRYEDVVTRSEELIAFAGGHLNDNVRQAVVADVGKTTNQFDLLPEEIEIILNYCANEMELLGYLDRESHKRPIIETGAYFDQQPEKERIGQALDAYPAIQVLQAEVTSLSISLETSNKSRRLIEAELQEKDQALLSLKMEFDEKRSQLQSLQELTAGLGNQIAQLNEQIVTKDMEIARLHDTTEMQQGILAQYTTIIQTLQALLDNRNEEMKTLKIRNQELEEEIAGFQVALSSREYDLANLQEALRDYKEIVASQEVSFSTLKAQSTELADQIATKEKLLNEIISSRAYRLLTLNAWKIRLWFIPHHSLRERLFQRGLQLLNSIRRFGVMRIFQKLKLTTKSWWRNKKYSRELNTILFTHSGKPVIVFRPLVDWNLPLFQRPHHIAKLLGEKDFLYFFCTPNAGKDAYDGFSHAGGDLFITNQYEHVIDIHPKILHLYSTDNIVTKAFVEEQMSSGDLIVYEYIDEIHRDISGIEIPKSVYERHEFLISDARVLLVVTAEKLLDKVHNYRRRNVIMAPNGVDFEHFSKPSALKPVSELEPIIARRKPMIGYFGALAKWFDYDLVIALATKHPDYEILLIGWDYDGSAQAHNLDKFKNIHVIGPIPYEQLPEYAARFDVATIPFQINDITLSTSPIKLFEYMALGKPIVTTDLPECRKYQSALVARSRNEFITLIETALTMDKNAEYKATLLREAQENTWRDRSAAIKKIIYSNLQSYESKLLETVEDELSAHCKLSNGVDNYYDEAYRKQERYYWFPVLNWIDNLSNVNSVLDAGCGYGTLLLYTHYKHNCQNLTAVDASDHYLPVTMLEHYQWRYIKSDIEREHVIQGEEFDLILFTEVLEHLNFHPLPVLKQLASLITYQGAIILSTPDVEEWGKQTKYYKRLDEIPTFHGQDIARIDDHIWHYSRSELEQLFASAGLMIIDWAFSRGISARHVCYLLGKNTKHKHIS